MGHAERANEGRDEKLKLPEQPEKPKAVAILQVVMLEDGRVTVQGPLDNLPLSLGLLTQAQFMIHDRAKAGAKDGPRIIAPAMGLSLSLP